jgi:Fe-S cluster biogenesis protein NfuA
VAEPIDLRVVGDRIEELLEHLERALDPPAFEQVQDVVSLVTDLYGGGLARILALVGEDQLLRERLADDDLVASLLVLHDLHPLDLGERVRRALESVRPYLGSHGGDVEVLGVDADEGVVSLRLLGSCDGCSSSSVTLELAVQSKLPPRRLTMHPPPPSLCRWAASPNRLLPWRPSTGCGRWRLDGSARSRSTAPS